MGMMAPGVRKAALTGHVASSVGWLGAVAAFLALAVAGLTTADVQRARGAYLAMEVTAWFVILPLSLGAFVTGIVQSLGTAWGLIRHYWVVVKLAITVVATVILLLHMQPIGRMAGAAANGTLSPGDLRPVRIQLVADAGLALIALIVVTALGVYKPRGMTPYGYRRQLAEQRARG
jgi:hypothetical protein